MNKKQKLYAIAGYALVQFLIANPAIAQDGKQLDEVVIQATKNDQKQSQTGKLVTIIGREQLERSAGKNLPELLSEQAGIIVGGATSNQGLNKGLFIRGAGTAYAVVLIDGIPAVNPSGAGSAFDLRMFGIDQIDHIEILKGGQSTIYGSDAVAGVINIVTKKGKDDVSSVFGNGTIGTYDSYKGTIGINSNVSGFSYNIGYTQAKTGGISEAADSLGTGQDLEKDGNRTAALNANFSLQASKQLTFSPFFRYFYGRYDFDAGAFVDNPDNNYKTKHVNAGLNTKYEFGSGKINLNYSYETTWNDTQNQYGISQSQGKMNLVDLYYNQQLGTNVTLLAGIDNRLTSLQGSSHVQNNLFSTYASVLIHDLKRLNLEVGGRYNHHDVYGDNFTYSITPSIDVLKYVKIFGTISTNFKAPTLDMLFGLYGANLDLKPEHSRNYEAGISLRSDDNNLSLRISAFHRDLTDAIVYGNQGYVNQVSQSAKGIEVEPKFRYNSFTFTGFYAYVEGTEFNFVNNKVENSLFRRPKHSVGINLGVQATSRFFVSTNYKYLGKRSDGDFDFNNPHVVMMPAFNLIDLYAEYKVPKTQVKLFVDLKNLFNEKYTEYYGYQSMGFNMNAGLSFNFR
jgi:vitamin B12 transporter